MERLGQEAFWKVARDAFATDALELTLLPTEQCNLRCVYCYEKFERGRMAPETVAAVKALIEKRAPDLKRLSIDWFGGEPLLAADLMVEIGGVAQTLSTQGQGFVYRSGVTTNGVMLTADLVRRLNSVGISSFHVSLDGPAVLHDRTRVARGGRGTFDHIARNLQNLRDSDIDFRIELRVHVTADNLESLDGFADELASTYLGDPRFSIYFFPIADLGGPNHGRFAVLDDRIAAAAVRRLTQRVRRASEHHASSEDKPYVCYAAKPNAWVIRSDGQLAKCTVALDDPRNHVGKLLPDGTLRVDNRRLDAWMRGWTTGDRKALFCPLDTLAAEFDLAAAS